MSTENGSQWIYQAKNPDLVGQTVPIPIPEFKSSFSDPEMGTVLHWHLRLCSRCDPERKVYGFGRRAEAFCDEYWEIIAEYAEYEGHYAMRGNP